MTHLAISLLGPFQVTLNGEAVTYFASDTARALLAYLAMHPGVAHRRDALAGLLWPEQPDAEALRNLRVALSRLRDAIGDRDPGGDVPLLQVTRRTIQLGGDARCSLDVRALREALAATRDHEHAQLEGCGACAQRLDRVADLYRGEFLAGFTLDSVPFEEWMVVERESLHWQALEALHALASYHEGQGNYEGAIECARRQVELESWREAAHRQWMRALALSGHRGAALAQYETCRRVLDDELGVEPEPATTALYEEIREGSIVAMSSLAPIRVAAKEPQGDVGPSLPQVAAPQIVEETAVPPALPVDVSLGGERRTVTVVHADLSGAAQLLARVGSEDWAEIVGLVLRALGREVIRFGGQVDRYGENGLVALFGASAAHEDDPERAVLAALAMEQAFGTHLVERTEETSLVQDLGLQVTVHTGDVVVTPIEVGGPGQSMAVGEALAFAARMQAAAEPGGVWVSEATQRLVEPLFEWESRGEIDAGPGARAKVYCAHGCRALADKMRGIPGLSSPLVGRQSEFAALREAVERLRAGLGGIVTMVGEAGIGKSRLVAEVRKDVGAVRQGHPPEREPPPRWVEGRCLSYATDVVYYVWLDMLHRLLGVTPDALPDTVRDALRQQVRALCAERMGDVYPFLARMMALPLDSDAEARLRGLDGEGLRTLTFRAAETLVECAAQREPLVLVCEDLHWADPTSLALLEQILATTDRIPLLIICVFRPEMEHGCWHIKETAARRYHHRHTDLWLRPLSAAESETLVGHLLHIEELPPDLRERILDRAEGNPFYVEETLRSLIDGGVIAYDEDAGRWLAAQDVSEMALPDTLHGVLAARIDRLPPGARRVLQLASVLGRVFSYPLLSAIAERSRLDDHLLTLQRTQMIREQARTPQLEYAFHHVLTQQAAYEGLLRRARRALHRRAAQTLERLYAERVEEQLGLLAHHWEQAGEAERAVHYLRRAGEQAADQYANQEANAYLSRALALTHEDNVVERYALLLVREGIYSLQAEREAQRRDLQALQQVARVLAGCEGERKGSRRLAEIALREAQYYTSMGELSAAGAAAQRAIHLAQAAQDLGLEAAGYLAWGDHDLYLAPETSEDRLQQALALSHAAGARAVEAESLRAIGLLLSNRSGDCARALSYLEQALRICREIGDRMGEGRMLDALGVAYYGLGDYATGIAHLEQGLRLCRETGNRYDESFATVQLGEGFYYQGDYARAVSFCERGLALGRGIGDRLVQVWGYVHLGLAHCAQGDYARGTSALGQGLCLAREAGNCVYEAFAGQWLGWAVHFQGDYARAMACLNQAAALAREGGCRPVEVAALIGLGVVYDALGEPAQARTCHDRARSTAREFFVHLVNRSLELHSNSQAYLGLLSHHLGDDDIAREHAWRALGYARDTGVFSSQARALTFLGHACTGMGLYAEAADAYQEALALRRQIDQHYLAVEPLAGLARVALAQGDRVEALARVGEVVRWIDAYPALEGTDEPLRVYLTYYQVLRANEDPHADEVLDEAHRLLQERAARIDDEALRRSFLENVAAHREIVAEYAREHTSPSP